MVSQACQRAKTVLDNTVLYPPCWPFRKDQCKCSRKKLIVKIITSKEFWCIGVCRLYRVRHRRYGRYSGGLEGFRGDAEFAGFPEAALDLGGGDVQQGCNLADTLPVGLQLKNLLDFVQVFGKRGGFDVVGLNAVATEGEVRVGMFLHDFIEDDVVVIVLLLPGTVFHLLDIAEILVAGGQANDDAGIEEVHQL